MYNRTIIHFNNLHGKLVFANDNIEKALTKTRPGIAKGCNTQKYFNREVT